MTRRSTDRALAPDQIAVAAAGLPPLERWDRIMDAAAVGEWRGIPEATVKRRFDRGTLPCFFEGGRRVTALSYLLKYYDALAKAGGVSIEDAVSAAMQATDGCVLRLPPPNARRATANSPNADEETPHVHDSAQVPRDPAHDGEARIG